MARQRRRQRPVRISSDRMRQIENVAYFRVFFAVFTAFAGLMLIGLAVTHLDRSNDPHALATVTSELPYKKGCKKHLMVSYSTPDGLAHLVRMCAQSSEPQVGQSVMIRYSDYATDSDVAPVGEPRLLPLVLGAAVFLVIGSVGLWFAWRRPDTLLRLGFRPHGSQ